MNEIFRKRRGPRVEDIEKVVALKEVKGYREDGIRSFREFIRQRIDYAQSTVYTYIKLYNTFIWERISGFGAKQCKAFTEVWEDG